MQETDIYTSYPGGMSGCAGGVRKFLSFYQDELADTGTGSEQGGKSMARTSPA